MEHQLTTYIRTKMLFKLRLKYLDDYSTVKLHKAELQRFNVTNELLCQLSKRGEIWCDCDGNFKALKQGITDLTLIKKPSAKLTPLHSWMREQLKYVELPISKQIPPYFATFLNSRTQYLELFFTVDNFCGRVHTPCTSLQRDLRPLLRLYDSEVVSLDVAQMQPTLLAQILTANLGMNDFSNAIDEGRDIYILLQDKAKLPDRDSAKKLLFKILFGYPSEDLANIFGGANWIDWINEYKSRLEIRNPHQANPHTNLAWLLQTTEVKIMQSVWQAMAQQGLPLLSVHDEIICRQCDQEKGLTIFNSELSKHFINFKITLK
jgi:hypothetical protein